MSSLACRNLSVSIGSQQIVGPVSMDFEAGKVTALLGPNGAGKSTWLSALSGALASSAGDVLLDGESVADIDPEDRARRVGFLAQGRDVAWGLTVETLVSLGRLPYHHFTAVGAGEDQGAVEAALARCDLVPLRKRNVLTLSGGERARALLARVLAGEPKWVLADEPLAGLDPAYQLDIVHLLRALAAEGRGVIVTVHDLTLVSRLADRVVILDDGVVVADGPPQMVLTPEVLADVYGVAIDVLTAEDGGRVVLPTRRLERAVAL